MSEDGSCKSQDSSTMSAAQAVAKTGYQGFGSFHSGDVDELVRQDDATYSAPALPFADPASSEAAECSSACFGDAAKRQFMIDFDSWTFINHGAFGGVAKPVYEAAELWRRHCEKQPLKFIDRELFPHLVHVIRQLASFVNCKPQDLVLLPNATTGLNAVIRSIKLQPADTVYSLNIGYGSVKKMLQDACNAAGASQVEAQVTFPISGPHDIMAVVEASLPSTAKLAVFDAVTSNTALVLPIQELVQLCKDRGVPVLIDAAHALGMLPINLQQLQPDFFVSNCHKWLCGARGSAMLYVAPQWQQHVQPPVLSHGAQAGFLSRFIWDGCRDYAPLLAISSAVRWWKVLGRQSVSDNAAAAEAGVASNSTNSRKPAQSSGHPSWLSEASQPAHARDARTAAPNRQPVTDSSADGIADEACCCPSQLAHVGDGGAPARVYMYKLLRAAANLLVARWCTCCLGPASMTAAMVLVQLPSGGGLPHRGQATSADAKYMQDMLHAEYGIEVPVKTIQDTLYVRISAHIYNTLQDYERLAAAVAQIQAGAAAQPGS